jgi:hypothetical protein
MILQYIQLNPVKYVQYKGGPIPRPLLLYFKRTSKKEMYIYVRAPSLPRDLHMQILIQSFLFLVIHVVFIEILLNAGGKASF